VLCINEFFPETFQSWIRDLFTPSIHLGGKPISAGLRFLKEYYFQFETINSGI